MLDRVTSRPTRFCPVDADFLIVHGAGIGPPEWRLLFDGEVARFEKTLIEEWQPRFGGMCGGLETALEDAKIRQAGQDLYYWVETEARFPFRTSTARFLSVGSYHILANDLRVGWHRDYEILLAAEKDTPDGA
jgi:hypothetical protein